MRGVVINVHEHGATARLEDGTLVAIPAGEFAANRATYLSSRDAKRSIELRVSRIGRHAVASIGIRHDEEPALTTDIAFEMRIGAYLKSTEEWAPSDRPAPAERHFIRKKRRADFFEARKKTT